MIINISLQSEERARKLRADLAIEEHRGQELERILKELLPYPKVSGKQSSHRGRRVGYHTPHMLWFDMYCLSCSKNTEASSSFAVQLITVF